MADVVTRLVVESKEYDSKIARATSGLTQFEKKCREVGGTLEFVEKEDLEFVKALGKMETVSSSAVGSLSELKKAFTELSVQYKNLTDAEKRSPYGRALSASLDELKGRIKGLEGDLRSANADLTDFGDVFKQLGSKIGIPAEMFSTLGIAVAAAGAAIKVGSDAFKRNEEMLDDWNATVQASKAIYDSFLVSLNTSDFSGFIRRMGSVARAAMEAYAALDKLGTFNAFNQINLQRAQTQFTEAVASYREGTGTESEVRAAADAWKNELETRRKMEQEAYLAKIREIAAIRGVDADLLTKALSGNYGDYETLKATTQMPTKSVYNSATRSFNDVIDNDAATEVQKLGQALRQLNDTQLQEIQALGRQAQATATEIAQVDRQTVRMLGKSGVGGGASAVTPTAATDAVTMTYAEDSIKAQEAKVAELTKLWKEASAELRDGYYAQLQKAKSELEEMTKGPLTELKGQMSFAVEPIKVKVDTKGLVTATNDADKMRASWMAAASAISTVGSALQQIDDPAAKIAGLVATAVAQIALGFAQATASPVTSAAGVFGWIAAATTGLATMISTITAIKSVTAGSYASGGIVPGNSFSGDNLTANVNSGELILNRAQQSNLASQLQSNTQQGGGASSSFVTGENIVLGVNNFLGRSGQGEIVTTQMLRRAGIKL